MTPQNYQRTLNWPGTIRGQNVCDITSLIESWNPFDTVLAMSAANAVINSCDNTLLECAETIPSSSNANLSVFYHFKPYLKNQKVVVVGRYPNLNDALEGIDYQVIEKSPVADDLPDTAAEYVIPQADWVFITSTSIMNKTFSRLCELATNAVTVLMGPTTPWLGQFSRFNVDFIAGVQVEDADLAECIAAEGGGTRLFEGGVRYALANISSKRLQHLKQNIAKTYQLRNDLKDTLDTCLREKNGQHTPILKKLDEVDANLSTLDTAYKRLWDANQSLRHP